MSPCVMRQRARILAVAVASNVGCLGGTTVSPLPAGGHHVLFVGNSLTYTNDLPATVAAIAASAGDTIRVATAAGPDLALIDHINGGTNALAQIALGGWEYVVLQQGPTPAGICRDSLVLWTKMFDQYIRAVGAKPALMMTWPIVGVGPSFDDVRVSFQLAAQAVNGVFLPAGEAWRAALRRDSTLALYGSDGFHPSPIGTFVAALEIYERVTGRDPQTLPALAFSDGRPMTLPEATIRLLQSAAHGANTTFSASPSLPQPAPAPIPPGASGHC